MKHFFLYLGTAAGFILPLFNIPLILKIRRNKSSKDISYAWAVGVWVCVVLMFPQTLLSPDLSFRIFGLMNLFLFSVAFYYIRRYR